MSMETKTIVRVNNVDIVATSDEQRLVPIKPICDALGIAFERQSVKLKEHPILSSSVTLAIMVANDGKSREMICLPMKYVFGWLFTINPSNVNEDARENLIRYQQECYDALYNHFTARAEFVEMKQKEIDRQLSIVEEAKDSYKSAKSFLNNAEAKLKKLRTLTMEDYDMERRQLKLDF